MLGFISFWGAARDGDHHHWLSLGQAALPAAGPPFNNNLIGLAGSGDREALPGRGRTKAPWKIAVYETAAMWNGRKTLNLPWSQ